MLNSYNVFLSKVIKPGPREVSRFAKAVSIGAVSPYKPKIPTDDDPDAAFKPVLSGVIDTHVGDGEKVEGHINEGY